MTAPNSGLALIERLLESVRPQVSAGDVEVIRSEVRGDPAFTLRASREGVADTLTLRVSDELVLVSIGDSQALEFGWADPSDVDTLAALVTSFCRGGFDVQVGSKDHEYYRIRGDGYALTIAHGVFSRLRSGELVWHTVERH